MEQDEGTKQRESPSGTFPVVGVGGGIGFNKSSAQQVSRELSTREFNTHYKLTIDFFQNLLFI